MATNKSEPIPFGDYLRLLRRRARMTQTELSIAVGYSPGQISMLENGQRHPDPTTVAALFLVALGIEKDSQASQQLISLAKAAALQHQRGAPAKNEGEVVVEKMIIRQQEEVGFLEDIPPMPSYLVHRPGPSEQLQQWLARERCAAVCGLPGMGKSTLAAQIAKDYSRSQPVFWLTLTDVHLAAPDALLRQLALFIAVSGANPSRLAPFARKRAANEPAINYQQQISIVASGLAELGTVLLVFDDAHLLASAQPIAQMLNRLLSLAPSCRILYVTRQDIDVPGVLHLNLNGMERSEAASLTQQLAQRAEIDVDLLLGKTGGNPMLLRLAIGALEQQPNTELTQASSSFAGYLIDTVLGSLDRSARQLLEFVSIWRSPIDLTDARLADMMISAWRAHDHRAAIASLQRNRLIDHVHHASPHPLLREPLLSELNAQPDQRRRVHALAATWALTTGETIEAAHHLLYAGEIQRACDLITAQEVDDYQLGQGMAAVTVIEEILTTARSQQRTGNDWKDVIRRLLILRGDLLANTTRADEALASYLDAMVLTTRTFDRAQLAEKMAMSHYRRGAMEDALALCDQVGEMLGANLTQEGITLRIEIETIRLRVLMTLTRFDEAQRICEQSLALVRPISLLAPKLANTVRAYANLALGYIARFHGDNEQARQCLLKSTKHAQAAKAASVEGDALSYLSATLRDLGDFSGAETIGQQALEIAYATDNEFLASDILHTLSLADYYHANLDQALTRARHVLQIKQPIGDIQGIIASRLVCSLVLAARGEVADALQCARQAANECALLENSWLRGLADYAIGIVLSFTEDLAGAERCLQHALQTDELKLDLPFYCGAEIYLGMIYVAQGRLSDAQQIAERTLPKEVGYSAALLQGLLRSVWLLGSGDRAAARTCAVQLIGRARACGFLIYAAEAERLLALTNDPPALAELPRRVCCGW